MTKTSLGDPTVGVSVVWAAVIIASSIVLNGTEYFSKLLPILGGGAAVTIILLGVSRSKT